LQSEAISQLKKRFHKMRWLSHAATQGKALFLNDRKSDNKR
jgi:hypothetical protein